MIKNIIFDVNKVLRVLNNEPLENFMPQKLFLKHKKQYETVMSKDYIKKVYHNSIFTQYDLGLIERDDLIKRLSEKFCEPLEVVTAVMDTRLLKKHNTVFKPMINLIKNLKKQGKKVFILSNMGKDMSEVLTEMMGKENFDDIIYSCDVHMVKPNKDIYEYAIERFNINPTESLFVDDTKPNLDTFAMLGGHTYLFDYTQMENSIDEIENLISKL